MSAMWPWPIGQARGPLRSARVAAVTEVAHEGENGPFPEHVAAGVRKGDPDAVGAVYAALSDRLLGYILARVRDRSTAEDILETTFIELLQRGRTIRGGAAAIKVWLFRAAHFNVIDHVRKQQRRPEELVNDHLAVDGPDEERGPEEHAEASETVRRVREAMHALSDDQRQVLLLRYVSGLSAPEVAAVVDKSSGAVRSLQHRGERALARLLAPHWHTASPRPSETSSGGED
jgi:RNA polymerase sigma-70 factor, ECF subfamily